MTTPLDLLAEVHRRGAVAYRIGDRLRIRPADAVPPELIERLRARKAELLPLVPERAPHAVDYAAAYAAGTAEDLAACTWAERHGHPHLIDTLAQLEHRCEAIARENADAARYHAAVARLVGFLETIRAAYRAAHEPPAAPEPAGPAWRVAVDRNEPKLAPIRLTECTTVVNVPLCIERTLIDLERAVAHRNAGRVTAYYAQMVDEYLERLAACGVVARVEVVQ